MSSPSAVFTLLAGMCMLFVPGVVLAFILRLRGMLAWSIAPAITLMVSGSFAVFFSFLGIPFNPVTFGLGALVLAGVAEIFARFFRLPTIGRSLPGRKRKILLGGFIFLAAIIPVLPLLFFYGLDQPIQHVDPAFHMNAVYLVEQTEAASSFHDFTRMWGLNTSPTTVPGGWHAFVSLFATKNTIIQATNSMFVLNSAVWVLGLATLALTVFPENNWIPFAAVAASTLVVEYPTYMHSTYPVLPNATTVAILPALMAWIYKIVFRRFRPEHVELDRRAVVGLIIAAGAVVASLMLTHPSVALNIAVLMILPLLFGWFNNLRILVEEKRWRRLKAEIAIAVSIIIVPSLSLLNGFVRKKVILMLTSYNTFPNPSFAAFVKTYALWPIYTSADASTWLLRTQMAVQYIIIFLTTVGIIAILRCSKQQRILIWSVLGAAMLTVTSMVRMGPLVLLAGLWYMSSHRTMVVQAVPQIIIMSYGLGMTAILLARISKKNRGKWQDGIVQARPDQYLPALVGVISVVAVVGGVATQPARYSYIERVYDPESNYITHVANADELQMMKDLGGKLEDGLVIGDPFNGSTLLQSFGSGEVLFPQPYYRPENKDETFLKDHFDEIHVNRNVCRLLEEMNVKYFYQDSDNWNYWTNSRQLAPGFYDVDTSSGFTKIAEGGYARVFRIDVCDQWE